MTTFKNRKTEETVELDVAVAVGQGVATATGAGVTALFDKVKAWGEPGGVADADFDLQTNGVTLRRCGVAGAIGPSGLTIDFMEIE